MWCTGLVRSRTMGRNASGTVTGTPFFSGEDIKKSVRSDIMHCHPPLAALLGNRRSVVTTPVPVTYFGM